MRHDSPKKIAFAAMSSQAATAGTMRKPWPRSCWTAARPVDPQALPQNERGSLFGAGSACSRTRPQIPRPDPGSIGRARLSPCLVNCLLCASLWLSLILAVWMDRGWIGLLFSGQLLSAGASMIQKLAVRTQYALVNGGASPAGWEEQHRV